MSRLRLLALACFAALVVALSALAPGVRVDSSAEALLPGNDPDRHYDELVPGEAKLRG